MSHEGASVELSSVEGLAKLCFSPGCFLRYFYSVAVSTSLFSNSSHTDQEPKLYVMVPDPLDSDSDEASVLIINKPI